MQNETKISGLTPEPTATYAAAEAVKHELEIEVERNLQRLPVFSEIEGLYSLFEVEELEYTQIARAWHNHQLRREYRDFSARWARARSWEKAELEFWYAYYYQEKRILEKIASHRDVELEGAEANGGSSTPKLSQGDGTFAWKIMAGPELTTVIAAKEVPYSLKRL
ncbi:hypothetical protein OPT61_g5968 [Boeremia exigua]|uniref:Uncharacterized protein n=1 Tax=Boeremia exigua TaxID=749465 RepID=A0ACC2I8J4_9PLEO|nr:hypothetical protein OPT61_g5968 [Boeremia exigua]